MTPKNKQKRTRSSLAIERGANNMTRWIGSTKSLVAHSVMFGLFVVLIIIGVKADTVMLILTTIVSLEAIYLSIFIQMSVNRQAHKLEEVSEDIEDIQEDMEEIQKDVEEISEDIEGIEKDVDEIQKDVDEIQEDVDEINEDEETSETIKCDNIMMTRIENTLAELIKEINELKKNQK